MVDTSGIMQFNSNPSTTAPIQRHAMANHFMPVPMGNAYAMTTPVTSPQAPQYSANNHFIYGPYTPQSPPMSFKQYQEECSPPRSMTSDTEGAHVEFQRELGQENSIEQDEPPRIKYEPLATTERSPTPPVTSKTITRNVSENAANEIIFNTEVDSLMRAIQLRDGGAADFEVAAYPSPPQVDEEKFDLRKKSRSPEEPKPASGRRRKERQKRYICDIQGCGKRCAQKTQLETHKRAHTGERPFVGFLASKFSTRVF